MLPERIYSPESQLRHPMALLRTIVKDLWAARYLGWRILVRDINARYRQTLLGYAWIVIPPLSVALGLTLATRAQVFRVEATDLPYPVYLVFSVSLWQAFAEAIAAPPALIDKSRSLLARVYFPREALLISGAGDALVNFVVRVALIAAVFLAFGISLSWGALAAVPVAMSLIVLGYAIGLLLAPFATLYHDLSRGITIVLMLWLFLSPVLYPLPRTSGTFTTIVMLNPVTPLLVTAREMALGMPVTLGASCAMVVAFSVLALCVGWTVCKVSIPIVIERLRS